MKNSKLSAIALLGAGALALSACSTSRVANTAPKDDTFKGVEENVDQTYLILSDAQRDLVARNNDFGLRLFRKTVGMDSRVVSPLSVTYLMGMLANGSAGQTQQEILRTLGWTGGNAGQNALEEANELACMMMQSFAHKDKAVTVDVANYVAVNKQMSLKDGFQRTVKDYYGAGVEALDFSTQKSAKQINKWCADQTRGMIPSIIDEVSPQDLSYLLNAIYFCGTWADKFDKQDTRLEPFRGYTRDIKRVDMMHRNDEYFYTSQDKFDAVQLPYGDGSFRMTVLLPHNDSSVDAMLDGLTAKKLDQVRADMTRCKVDLKLPRFTTETKIQLNDVVSALGAPTLFTSSADFSGLANGNFYVSKMLQKAKIEVSEEGTKAAAVTAAMVAMTSLNPEGPRRVSFHADHPFVYLISEAQTGAILFIGQYAGE